MTNSMDVLGLAYSVTLFSVPILAYIVFHQKEKNGRYSIPSWYNYFKKLLARNVVKEFLATNASEYDLEEDEEPVKLTQDTEEDVHLIKGADQKGNSVFIKFATRYNKYAEICVQFRLADGRLFTLPNEPKVLLCSLRKREWKAAGLSITSLEPFRRIRIVYNGLMKCGADIEHFKFNLIWTGASKPLFYPCDFDKDLFSDAISREPWKDGDWLRLLGDRKGFEQYGALHGEVESSLLAESKYLNIPTIRKRHYGVSDRNSTNRDLHIFVAARDGTCLNFGARSIRHGSTQLRYGSVFYANKEIYSISENDISLPDLAEGKQIPNVCTLHVKTKSSTIKCVLHFKKAGQSRLFCDERLGWEMVLATAECEVNEGQGRAIISSWYRIKGSGRQYPEPLLMAVKPKVEVTRLVVDFEAEDCKILEVTGGKGNSLALLASIKDDKVDKNIERAQHKIFAVPEGFVITVAAFRRQIATNKDLDDAIGKIEGNLSDSELKRACERVVELFTNETVFEELNIIIRSKLAIKEIGIREKLKGDKLTWAVRSSGVGEDSDDFSAAGQNATILGCVSDEDVIKAVTKCWASLFSHQSVQYRKQRGLAVRSDMGVVVQRMVEAEAAGVLFTSHPTSGDVTKMVITSNFGLGESVVSGTVEPDTIILHRTRNNQVRIGTITPGSKKYKIIVPENGGTITQPLDTKEQSINEDQALILGGVGIELERRFGSPRDIEWAFSKGKLFLLQSRPVTTLNSWTDFELEHELDHAMLSDQNVYTTANLGEVMPGAVTTLSNTIVCEKIGQSVEQSAAGINDSFGGGALVSMSSHIFLDVYNVLLKLAPKEVDIKLAAQDLSLFGHSVTTESMLQEAKLRHGPSNQIKELGVLLKTLYYAWKSSKLAEKSKQLAVRNIEIRKEMNLEEMHNAIIDYSAICKEVCTVHSITSSTSTFYQMIALLVLAGNEKEFKPDHYTDIALLLSSCSDLVSAEVPTILEKIAAMVRASGKAQEFGALNAQDGVDWLTTNVPEAAQCLQSFLGAHGHRSFREFELMEPSWAVRPEVLIRMIQANSKAESVTKRAPELSVDETISKLKTPTSKIALKMLKLLMTRCRNSVANREITKSELVRVIDKMRYAYRLLGKRLAEEGYISDQTLVFHFTAYELRKLIRTRDPTLVTKAVRRQKLYPKLDKLVFPEMVWGQAEPEKETVVERGAEITIEGTPACGGEVTARCCCIKSLDDIGQLQSGDVLVTHSTDIGWSPYFPMLSGIVTELGGLISHGAVVAREYGLPCLVGVQNATSHFRTGDMVRLSGSKAHIQLLTLNETGK